LPRNPLDKVRAIAPDLRTKVVALNASRTSAPAHVCLHECVTVQSKKCRLRVSSAVYVVLSQLKNNWHRVFEFGRQGKPRLEFDAVAHGDHATHLNVVAWAGS
jgi:hypothetical protein